jgi:hypothetical protein
VLLVYTRDCQCRYRFEYCTEISDLIRLSAGNNDRQSGRSGRPADNIQLVRILKISMRSADQLMGQARQNGVSP